MSKLDKSKRSTRTSTSGTYGKGGQFQLDLPKGPHTTGVEEDPNGKDLFWHTDGICFTPQLIDLWIAQSKPSEEVGNLSDHRLIAALEEIRKLKNELLQFNELENFAYQVDPEVLAVFVKSLRLFKEQQGGVDQFIKKDPL